MIPEHPTYLLERFVHHVLAEDARPSRELVTDALASGSNPRSLLADVLWPAAECIQQLQFDGRLPMRVYNNATRSLFITAGDISLPVAQKQDITDRSIFIFSAPDELSDLGAHLQSLLAESHGFTTLFAGARLSFEEIAFALNRLEPDVVLVHGSLASSLPQVNKIIDRLHAAGFWPATQIGVVGAVAQAGRKTCKADVLSEHPVEMLELLALSPGFRARKGSHPAIKKPLQMPTDTTPQINPHLMRDSLLRHFPGRTGWN